MTQTLAMQKTQTVRDRYAILLYWLVGMVLLLAPPATGAPRPPLRRQLALPTAPADPQQANPQWPGGDGGVGPRGEGGDGAAADGGYQIGRAHV